MLATGANIRALQPGFRRDFERGRGRVAPWWNRMADQLPSTTSQELQGFLAENLKMRKWVGPRLLKSLFTHEFLIKNDPYELTVSVSLDDIEDDRLNVYGRRFELIGKAGEEWPDQLLKEKLQENPTGFDGRPFFDSSHPLDPSGVQDNDFNLALSADNFDTVWTAMTNFTGEDGENLGVMPDTLVVPPQLRTTAKEILMADRLANGATNVQQGDAEILVVRDLANQPKVWYLQDSSKGILPWIFQLRKAVRLIMKDGPMDDNVFWDKDVVYGIDSRGQVAPGLWWLQARSTGP
jgi:phage major head subunit gpT-like protein